MLPSQSPLKQALPGTALFESRSDLPTRSCSTSSFFCSCTHWPMYSPPAVPLPRTGLVLTSLPVGLVGHYTINDSLIKVSPKGMRSCFKSKTSR